MHPLISYVLAEVSARAGTRANPIETLRVALNDFFRGIGALMPRIHAIKSETQSDSEVVRHCLDTDDTCLRAMARLLCFSINADCSTDYDIYDSIPKIITSIARDYMKSESLAAQLKIVTDYYTSLYQVELDNVDWNEILIEGARDGNIMLVQFAHEQHARANEAALLLAERAGCTKICELLRKWIKEAREQEASLAAAKFARHSEIRPFPSREVVCDD